jgi:ubiquinone/menaquinone biosynthesis C-methylase UbiE
VNLIHRLLKDVPNVSRHRLREWVSEAANVGDSKEFRVLDAGAGKAPFRRLFAKVSYETADFGKVSKSYGKIDYVCDLSAIPVADETYDLVLCTQVLEHLPEPLPVLREFQRILKPGGQAWLSAPLFYAEHEKPYDFHRYTQFAWRRMAEESGFDLKEIEWLEGYYGTLSYQAKFAAQHLPRKWRVWRVVMALLARTMARAELREKVKVGMPKNYRCIMVKP